MRHFLLGSGHAILQFRCELGTIVDRGLTCVAMRRYSSCLRGLECKVVGSHPPPLQAVLQSLMLCIL